MKIRAELLKKRREIEDRERLLQQRKEDYEMEKKMKLAEVKAKLYKKYDDSEVVGHTSSLPNPDSVHGLMRAQTEISKMMMDQQRLVSLPRRELQIFDGKIQDNRAFITAFKHNIDRSCSKR